MTPTSAPEPVAPALPQHHPTARELDDLELLLGGALAPTTAFNEPGSPATLTLPPDVAAAATAAGGVELVDPEGLPLARVTVPAHEDGAGWPVSQLTHAQFGPFRRLYLTPAQVRATYAGSTFVLVDRPLTSQDLAALWDMEGPLVLLTLVGAGRQRLSPVGLLRATLAAAESIPRTKVVAVPLADHGDPVSDGRLEAAVLATYAAGDPVGVVPHTGVVPEDIQAIVDADRPPPGRQGVVLFFTGLSGSGKSTVARAVMDTLLEEGRSVTSLDGDVVRRNLSAGLTFSRADRETNIRRIGWVAAEISRHGGLAVCSPIAPFDATRQQVRRMVEDAGGAFVLVHVATPLEECERRDRKGLYARARRGEIPDFTGISSPYEVPADASVALDTTGRTIEDCRDEVLARIRESRLVQ